MDLLTNNFELKSEVFIILLIYSFYYYYLNYMFGGKTSKDIFKNY